MSHNSLRSLPRATAGLAVILILAFFVASPGWTQQMYVSDPPQGWRVSAPKDEILQSWVDEVAWEGIERKIRKLESFGTRFKQSPQHAAVAETLVVFFHNLGLDAELQTFTQPSITGGAMDAHNVIATQPGTAYPNKVVIVCGHYDSISESPMTRAPGADDNATGVAAVQTAAEILSRHQFEYTIQYVCFASEEKGAWGSGTYVRRMQLSDKHVIGAVNVDMLGYRPKGGDIFLEVEANEASRWLGEAVKDAAHAYSNRRVRLRITDEGWSDNYSFWKFDLPAVNCEEDWAITGAAFNPHWHTTDDVIGWLSSGWTVGNVKVAVASTAVLAIPVHVPPVGSIAGTVAGVCADDSAGVSGIVVDATDNVSGLFAGSDTTGADGAYAFIDLDSGGYELSIVPPLGYDAEREIIGVAVVEGTTTSVDFRLECGVPGAGARGVWYWKRQFASALRGNWGHQASTDELCRYLDEIDQHFNRNPLNPIRVYVPPDSGNCDEKLRAAADVLKLKGNVVMPDLAYRHLMAVLLNVAAGNVGQWEPVSRDGATVSQAITWCDSLLSDDVQWNDWVAHYIAVCVNAGWQVMRGVIPADIADIAYAPGSGEHAPVAATSLDGAYPNPFNPSTTIHFTVAAAEPIDLRVFDVAGRLVSVLVSGTRAPGTHTAAWNGLDTGGAPAASGIYFVRLTAGGQIHTQKVVLLK